MRTRLPALWRGLPAPIRRAAHQGLSSLRNGANRTVQAIRDGRRAAAEQAARARTAWRAHRWPGASPSGPVTVVGFLGAVHGLGEGGRMLVRGFQDGGQDVRALDLSRDVGFTVDIPCESPAPRPWERGVVISHINPPELLYWIGLTEGREIYRRRHIGYWAWELEEIPEDWLPAFDLVDEVWAPSEFAARAIRAAAPRRVKVTAAPYPVYLNPRPAADRARFDLPAGAVVVLMAFDLRSTAQRKNPYAALRTFHQAVSMTPREAILVCKVMGVEHAPQTFQDLQALTADMPAVRLMTQSLSAQDMAVLTASCDIVLSLHRSEGYGLLLAEAIWNGKAAIATGWSANAEFMDPASSVLVDYQLTSVRGDGAIYTQGQWAEADEMDAAAKLARLIDNDAWRQALSKATAENRHASFQPRAWTALMKTLLPGLNWPA
ncbi:glycosyltransferase [Caulobacter sp.]|uniref:glycosyltransferase n=1 Tax=Caulobacter sp. TaxID=78 RepID=UPI003BACC29D